MHESILYVLSVPSCLVIAALVVSMVTGDRFMLKQVLIAVDQLGNALLRGWSDETISSAAWRGKKQSKAWRYAQVSIDFIALHVFRDANHCEKSYASERLRTQLPPELRECE